MNERIFILPAVLTLIFFSTAAASDFCTGAVKPLMQSCYAYTEMNPEMGCDQVRTDVVAEVTKEITWLDQETVDYLKAYCKKSCYAQKDKQSFEALIDKLHLYCVEREVPGP